MRSNSGSTINLERKLKVFVTRNHHIRSLLFKGLLYHSHYATPSFELTVVIFFQLIITLGASDRLPFSSMPTFGLKIEPRRFVSTIITQLVASMEYNRKCSIIMAYV